MPWTKADVDKHKKGLTDAQKDRWVAVANSALKRCMDGGGSESTCAASAIRQANGVAGNEGFLVYKRKQEANYTITVRQHQGRQHMVVPVVMMVEGVHNGNHGPIYHSINELGRYPESWNGIPVVINHPEIDGNAVSANHPEIIDQQTVGRVYNTYIDGGRLRAEAWIDEEKLRQLSAILLTQLQNGELIEVSLGLFSDEETSTGTWNGETYEAIARNHRPDHLALLPGGVGACSCADGCGIRLNEEGGQKVNDDLLKTFKDVNKEGFIVQDLILDQAQGYRELVDAVRQKLDSMDTEHAVHFLQEVYDGTVIYEVRMRVGGSRLLKQAYTFNGGTVELQGNPEEVRRKVEYIAVAESSGIKRTKFNSNKKEEMADNTCAPCIKAKVDALIANENGSFTEEDRVVLETLSEALLDKLVPKVVEKEKRVEVNVLSEEDKEALNEYKRLKQEKRNAMIKAIQDNSKEGTWTADELNGMKDAILEKIVGMVKKQGTADYSAAAGTELQDNAASQVKPLPPTGITFKTK